MAGHNSYQQGIINRYYEHRDTIALQKLSEIVSDLYLAEGGSAQKLWKNAAAALEKVVDKDDPRAKKIIASRDLSALARLIGELSTEARSAAKGKPADDGPIIGETPASRPAPPAAPTTQPAQPAPPTEAAAPTPEQLKSALKMFRKRVKLKRLDDESKLGRSPLSSGKKVGSFAIMAPREYPPAVWEELARQGKLKSAGGSFYELVE